LPSICGPFSRIDFPEFNLGSRKQIGRYLQFFGWVPRTYTEKGNVIVDEAVLSKVKGIPEASLIAEYLLIQKRMAQIDSWLTEEQKTNDGRVHGRVNPIGAVTGRMTHSSPNMAQVPANYSPYGLECRSCWIVPKGYKLVGVDASGLELRMLAHYMDDEGYTDEVINGDIHTANQIASGLATRDSAKTFIYAFLYGAGDAKIGSIVGGSKKDGERLKHKFLTNTPSLRQLRERVVLSSQRGYLKGIDGRKLIIRSEHASLNTLLQSAGAVIMKKALTILDEYATIHNIDYKFVGNIHDEFQAEVREDQVDNFGWLAVECIKSAGLKFNLRCPLDGEYKVGNTWAETH
jgi:DNA polymerase I-like protein with 3'-5' exonuclease and polymerase domains